MGRNDVLTRTQGAFGSLVEHIFLVAFPCFTRVKHFYAVDEDLEDVVMRIFQVKILGQHVFSEFYGASYKYIGIVTGPFGVNIVCPRIAKGSCSYTPG